MNWAATTFKVMILFLQVAKFLKFQLMYFSWIDYTFFLFLTKNCCRFLCFTNNVKFLMFFPLFFSSLWLSSPILTKILLYLLESSSSLRKGKLNFKRTTKPVFELKFCRVIEDVLMTALMVKSLWLVYFN